LNKNEGTNLWKTLTGLLGDTKRFSWLMNFINLKKLEVKIKNFEEQEELVL
jgi:hypothetical protein